MTTYKVGYLIGSLARASINRKLTKALVRLAPPELANVGDFLQGSAALQLRLRP
jgi:NAD(P)H-dependent FMN reductase